MKKITLKHIIGAFLLVSVFSLSLYKPFTSILTIPKKIILFEGQSYEIDRSLPVTAKLSNDQSVTINETKDYISIDGKTTGTNELILDIAGFPIKKVNVEIINDFKLVPGGQSIGVKLNTVGVLVVGHHLVSTERGQNSSPGEEAGIKVGDIITEINGKAIQRMADVSEIVQSAGEEKKPLNLVIKREDKTIRTKLTPQKDDSEQSYKLGLYIRDSAAGIGTMTFYHPDTKKYGALGHVISDADTKKPIVVKDGQIVSSTVTSIERGSNGNPGEKLARFSPNKEVIGNIKRNSPFGIFGSLKENIQNNLMDDAIPITLSHQVKEGPAEILTVVDGTKVERFDIEIVSSIPQKFPAIKGMVLKVTDKELLKKTGGIVQGMSGSPIIQDGKLIGAVTHVFVNDPTSGYGVHIEWMLHEAGLNIYKNEGEKKQAS